MEVGLKLYIVHGGGPQAVVHGGGAQAVVHGVKL